MYRALARLDRLSGNFIGALEWLRRAEQTAGQGKIVTPLAGLDGLRGIILVEMGHVQDGRRVLSQTCAELERLSTPVDLAQTLLFRAYAEFRSGDSNAAAATFARALTVAEGVGYDQMLVSEALSVRDMLETFAHQPHFGPQTHSLLTRAQSVSGVRERLSQSDESALRFASQPWEQAATLEVRALGSSRVLKQGVEVSRTQWVSQRTRELFFFLIDRMPIHRDKVLGTFWPEKPPARAVANLHQTLYRLRRAVGCEVVILKEQECRLAPDISLDYDVARFEAEAQAALKQAPNDWRRIGALAWAVERYMGDYLPDLASDWALERHQALKELYVSVLCAYADELINLTRYTEAREVLAKALTAEPLRDDLHERMLLCLSKLGRRHEVVDHYHGYRETLRTELGLDPSPEVRALYARLIA
ncbi:MAG TPA: BTAD domain-containing putative transcriptional regulator [Anaerolineae bacterium]|nr:BTAD domain-containing putative transcriptional regulator [Anaerolineae bacterium]